MKIKSSIGIIEGIEGKGYEYTFSKIIVLSEEDYEKVKEEIDNILDGIEYEFNVEEVVIKYSVHFDERKQINTVKEGNVDIVNELADESFNRLTDFIKGVT